MNKEVADAIRAVNAAVKKAEGRNHLPLGGLWSRLEKELEVAKSSGDNRAALQAITTYRQAALRAIERSDV